MSGRPILDDTDFNFTEIVQGRLENVSTLPTSHGTDHKGYSVYYKNKIWVWDGSRWNTWGNIPWTDEDNYALNPASPRAEDEVVKATSDYLGTSFRNISLTEGYSDDSANPLGTIHFIGASTTVSDWNEITGRSFLYTAQDGSWFNIKHSSGETLPDNHKAIDTGTETDIFGVVKALFSYDNMLNKWLLVSFERRNDNLIHNEDLQGELKQIICCKEHLVYELHSSAEGEKLILGDAPSGLKIVGDPCYYFKVKIEGEWSADLDDNDMALDFQLQPVFCQFLTRPDESSAWTFEKSIKEDWVSGNTIAFCEEFLFLSDTDLFVACSLSDTDNSHGTEVTPIQNWDRFWIKMTISKCPKTSWFRRFTIEESAIVPDTQISGIIPTTAGNGLPFDGYYEVHIFLKVREYESDMQTKFWTMSPQLLEVMGSGDNWQQVDESGDYTPPLAQTLPKWFNNSLQGSAIVKAEETSCALRNFSWRATLPNGLFKQVLGGYLHAKFIGKTEGPLCNDE